MPARALAAGAAALSLYAVYCVVAIVPPEIYRPSFLLVSLLLLAFVSGSRVTGALVAAGAAASLGYFLWQGDAILYRAATPTPLDIAAAFVAFATVLEATRRSTGWILPAVAVAFFAYAFAGPWLPGALAHRGYDAPRLAGSPQRWRIRRRPAAQLATQLRAVGSAAPVRCDCQAVALPPRGGLRRGPAKSGRPRRDRRPRRRSARRSPSGARRPEAVDTALALPFECTASCHAL